MDDQELYIQELKKQFRWRERESKPLTLQEKVGTYERPEDLPPRLKAVYDRRKAQGRPLFTRSEKE